MENVYRLLLNVTLVSRNRQNLKLSFTTRFSTEYSIFFKNVVVGVGKANSKNVSEFQSDKLLNI